jgi:thiol-disulfide isomerase/thioredoxin
VKPALLIALTFGAVAFAAGSAYTVGRLVQADATGAGATDSAEPRRDASALLALPVNELSGNSTTLGNWSGKVRVVNFWASWCAPCREEMPDFDALQQQYPPPGVQFVGVALDNPEGVSRFLSVTPVKYPLVIADTRAMNQLIAYGNRSLALPFTVIIDSDARVVSTRLGRYPREELAHQLEALGARAR